jgi:hypothetical protein
MADFDVVSLVPFEEKQPMRLEPLELMSPTPRLVCGP